MKNRTKFVLTMLLVFALLLGYVFYERYIKVSVYFVDDATLEINEEFKADKYITEVKNGKKADVICDNEINNKKLGDYEVTYRYKSKEYKKVIKVIDTTKPTFSGLDDINVSLNSNPNLDKGVEVNDNSLEKINYTIDKGNLDVSKAGKYEITYHAKDSSGNETIASRKVNVVRNIGTKSQSSEKVVYLTFDDGPSLNTKKIIDILERYQAKATFFVTGCNQSYNYLIKEAHQKGHTIALHTYSHDYKTIYSSEDAYFNDLEKVGQMVKNQIGFVPHYIRFPGGSSNTISRRYCNGIMSTLSKKVIEKGYQYYDWNADSTDASGNHVPVSKLISNATLSKSNNIMILCHDTSAKDTTVEALPSIIEHYKNLGYSFKGIDDNTFTPHQGINN